VGSLCIKATVVACLLIALRNGQVQKQIRTLGTSTRELLRLREWLLSEGGTQVAMESTGVCWKPVDALLEGALENVAANAQHVRKVPGRKTDVKDAEWIADLLCHGLLRPSFVAPPPIRELRDLTRYRPQAGAESGSGAPSFAEAAGNSQHQVGKRGHGRFRRIWPADAARAGRGSS